MRANNWHGKPVVMATITKVDDTHENMREESAVWMTEGHMKPLRTKKLAKWTSASSAPNMRSIFQFSTPMISTLMSN